MREMRLTPDGREYCVFHGVPSEDVLLGHAEWWLWLGVVVVAMAYAAWLLWQSRDRLQHLRHHRVGLGGK